MLISNPHRRELARYFHIDAPEGDLEQLRTDLAANGAVEAAYIKPPAEPALPGPVSDLVAPKDTATPDFVSRQKYLDPAPVGIDARYAWTLRGGKGDGINVTDCEWNWNLKHEDLATQIKGVVIGSIDPNDNDDRHGTCVAGVLVGNENAFGITGIAPKAMVGYAVFTDNDPKVTSTVIIQAADLLSSGDVLILEIHRPGPRTPNPKQGQKGYMPIEWWADDFRAIAYASLKGIVVVEAAGNGGENLDDPVYNTPLEKFPNDWRNPFSDPTRASGAILVGAGMPPPGTHGRTKDEFWGFGETYIDRVRCVFSNYGNRVDCQGWGYEVTTLSLGDLYPGQENKTDPAYHNRLYTDNFGGTSSASPIIAGAVVCTQGALRAADGICANYLINLLFCQDLFPDSLLVHKEGTGPIIMLLIPNRPRT